MSERIVNDPSLHGWVEENGKWVWEGGATTGHIEDGTVQGQITTWDVAKTEWTPDSSLTIDGSGTATFSGNLNVGGDVGRKFGVTSGQGIIGRFQSTNTSYPGTITFKNGNTTIDEGIRVGADADNFIVATGQGETRLTIDSVGDATFSGTVDAAGLTVNGQPISGGGGNHQGLGGGDVWADRGNGQGAVYFGAQNQYLWFTDAAMFQFAGGPIRAPDFIANSDERLKDNITTVPVGLIDSLKGREWEWKESGEKGSGVVAQELEQVLPHLVHEDEDGMKSVSYMGLCAYLIEELKDCRERLAVLEAKE